MVDSRTSEQGTADRPLVALHYAVQTDAMARKKSNPLLGLAGIAVIGVLCCGGGYAVLGGDDTDPRDSGPAVEVPAGQGGAEAPVQEQQVDEPDPEAPAQDEPEPESIVEDEPVDESAEEVYYKNCAAARDAGAAPLHRGEPGYRAALDRDDDGTACEVD